MSLGVPLLCMAILAQVPGDTPNDVPISLPYVLTDGLGFRWDFGPNGSVGDGSNDAYDGGLVLHINGEPFPNLKGAKLRDRRTVVFGPADVGGVRVTRCIFVPEDAGLARLLEIVENPSSRPARVRIQISTRLGGRIGTLQTARKDSGDGPGLIAFVTDDGDPRGGDPAILHVLGAEDGTHSPSLEGRLGDRVIRYGIDGVVVPPYQKVLFVHAEAQRKTTAEAIEEMDRLRLGQIIGDLPRREGPDLLNFRLPFHLPDDAEVAREMERDVLTLRDGDTIYGEARNPTYKAITDFGPMEIPSAEVVAIVGKDRPGRPRLYLKTGEVYRVRLPELVLDFELPSGHILRVPGDRIASVGFRRREGELEGHDWDGQVATLISGDRLVGSIVEESLTFRMVYGKITLPTDRISRIERRRQEPGLQRVHLRHGSSFQGLLEESLVRFKIRGEREVKIPAELIQDLFLASATLEEDGPRVVLETGDQFVGRIANESITLETPFARIDLVPRQVRSIKAIGDSPGEFQAVLWDETTVRGELHDEKITVLLRGGEQFLVRSALLSEAWVPHPDLPDPIRARVENLISELGAPEWDRRDKAEKGLVEVGRPAVGLLLGFVDTEDPEVRERVRQILHSITHP